MAGTNRAYYTDSINKDIRYIIKLFIIICMFVSCSCPEYGPCDAPGICPGQVTVIFMTGVTRAQIDSINAEIGATVLIEPIISTAYRIKLPPCWDYEKALEFYGKKPEVQAVLWASNYGTA